MKTLLVLATLSAFLSIASFAQTSVWLSERLVGTWRGLCNPRLGTYSVHEVTFTADGTMSTTRQDYGRDSNCKNHQPYWDSSYSQTYTVIWADATHVLIESPNRLPCAYDARAVSCSNNYMLTFRSAEEFDRELFSQSWVDSGNRLHTLSYGIYPDTFHRVSPTPTPAPTIAK